MKRVAAVLLSCIWASAFAAEPARWAIDYSASKLGFTAEQAEAPFDGSFAKFDADVRFDPAALADSRAEVAIDTASVATANKDRDGILRGEGWFESSAFPAARFTAKEFVKTNDGFEARGELTIRTTAVPVAFAFTVKQDGNRVELNGKAQLDRLAFGLGTGEWADPKAIGTKVTVVVKLVGTRG
jgi:polyisoprenoid-binding protein YceI